MDNDITKEPTAFWLSGNPVKDTLWAWLKAQPQTDTVTITSAQLLALKATPIELVPAPGLDKYIEVLAVKLILDSTVTGYVEDTAGTDMWNVQYNSTTKIGTEIEPTGFIDQTADTLTNWIALVDDIVTAANSVNKNVTLANVGVGEIITGTGTLIVKTTYFIRDAGLA